MGENKTWDRLVHLLPVVQVAKTAWDRTLACFEDAMSIPKILSQVSRPCVPHPIHCAASHIFIHTFCVE